MMPFRFDLGRWGRKTSTSPTPKARTRPGEAYIEGRPLFVTTGHSRSKNGVALLAYDPVVHREVLQRKMRPKHVSPPHDCRVKPGNDDEGIST
jgi:hypothetical protein